MEFLKKKTNILRKIGLVSAKIFVLSLLFLGSFHAFANWQGPAGNPPLDSTALPLLVNDQAQDKEGGLSVDSMSVEGGNSVGPVELSLGGGNNGKIFINPPENEIIDSNVNLYVGGGIRSHFQEGQDEFLCLSDGDEVERCNDFPGSGVPSYTETPYTSPPGTTQQPTGPGGGGAN